MTTIVPRHEIERFMREHLGVVVPGDVLRIEMTPYLVTVTSALRDEHGHMYRVGDDLATEQTVIDVRKS